MQIGQIGKHKIVGKIGQGAMGEAVLNRMVAIKTISADLGRDETGQRFQRRRRARSRPDGAIG